MKIPFLLLTVLLLIAVVPVMSAELSAESGTQIIMTGAELVAVDASVIAIPALQTQGFAPDSQYHEQWRHMIGDAPTTLAGHDIYVDRLRRSRAISIAGRRD